MKFPEIEKIAVTNIIIVNESNTLQQAVDKMVQHNLRDVVIDRDGNGEFGILMIQDILRTTEQQQSLNLSIAEAGYRRLPTVPHNTHLLDILGLFNSDVSYLAILDEDDDLYGIVSQTDIVSHIDPKIIIEGQRIGEIVSKHSIKTADINSSLQNVFSMMLDVDDAIILTENNKPAGIITSKNALQAIKNQAAFDSPAREFMSSPLETVPERLTIRQALDYLQHKRFKRLVVASGRDELKGIITQQDLIFNAYVNWHQLSKNKHKEFSHFASILETQHTPGDETGIQKSNASKADNKQVTTSSYINQGEQYVISTLRDIANREQAEKALKDSEARFRAQYNSIPIPTYTWQKQKNNLILTDYNDAAFAMTKGDIINYVGKTADQIYDQHPEIILDLKKCFREKQTFKKETKLNIPINHTIRNVIATYVFIPPDLVMIHTEDVTEQHQTQEKLRALLNDMESQIHHRTESLKSANSKLLNEINAINHAEDEKLRHLAELAHLGRVSLMGEMATSIAHELNQPLTAITTYCDAALRMLENDNLNHENMENVLSRSRDQALRAGEIIRHLRQLTSKHKPETNRLSLNELIHLTLDFSQNRLKRHSIHSELELDENLPLVYVDKIQVEQVLLNIVNNAIDALQQKYNIVRKLVIRSKVNEKGYVQIEIEDNGPGMNEETLSRIFDRFHSTKDGIGMGMGLPICRTIMESHRGSLWAEATLAVGSIFYITFPKEP